MSHSAAQLVRLAESDRAPVFFTLDGIASRALAGDTVLTAILTQRQALRVSEFSGEPRAGFCLIGACQDCWVRTEDGQRLRACSTLIEGGMRLITGIGDAARPAGDLEPIEGQGQGQERGGER